MKELTIDENLNESKRLDTCYANALGKGGKTVLKDLKEYCQHGRSPFNVGSIRQTDFNIGVQSVMIYIEDRLSKKFTKELIAIKKLEVEDE